MLGFLSAILAGAAMSVQGVMNTRLGEKVGTLETNAFVQLIGFLLALLIAEPHRQVPDDSSVGWRCSYLARN